MTYEELVRVTARRNELEIGQTEALLKEVFEVIVDVARLGKRQRIPGFGTFFLRTRKAWTAKVKGVAKPVAESRSLRFSPAERTARL